MSQSLDRENASPAPGQELDIRTGRATFRPRARLLRTLGHDLITNEFVALQELVKNAYDADAKRVILSFEGPLLPGQGSISVVDDGTGMPLETLLGSWMEPATIAKIRRPESQGRRRVTGEKGIGRFAAARVAGSLELESVASESGKRITARFDWGRFEDEERYLDEVDCVWREEPTQGATHGTTLRLVGLRDDWTADAGARFATLRGHLSRLVSPLAPARDFTIELDVPEPFSAYSGRIAPPAFLGKPRYWLVGKMLSDGTIDAVYEGPDGTHQILEHGEQPKVVVRGREPHCGELAFEFRAWDRANEDLRPLASEFGSTLRDIKRDLDAASGISIYRDDFRVMLPENADWLRLDLRRVQNPTMRLSNNQIVGVVAISRDRNPGIVDQTNRQGIVDTPDFEDFRAAVRDVLSKLEVRREVVRHPQPHAPTRPTGLFGRISIAPIRDYVAARYANDRELQRVVDEAGQAIQASVNEVKTVLVRYRRLATLGQLVDGILHEGRTPLSAIANAVRFLQKDLQRSDDSSLTGEKLRERVGGRLSTITQQTGLLGDLFRRIAPFSSRQRGRPRNITIERILADITALLRKEINEAGAVVELPEGATPVTVDVADMQGIFRNLIENALFWVSRMPPGERKVKVELEQLNHELRVMVSDSGPGVPDEVRDRIMEPYFSTRPDGQGLGLALAGELAAEYDGALDLLADGPLDGATFCVTLRRRVG